jgi:hypothetical protein
MAAAVRGVVAGDHYRADAHAAQLGEALAHAGLDDVLEMDGAQDALAVRDQEGRAARAGDRIHLGRERGWA